MKLKFELTNIFLQVCIFIISLFTMITQFGSIRQPTRLFIQIICVISILSIIINFYNYVREEKD